MRVRPCGRSSGASVAAAIHDAGQRSANAQPRHFPLPGLGARRRLLGPPREAVADGTELMSSFVYGCAGASRTSLAAARLDDLARVHDEDAIGEVSARCRDRA
jgi:hypothetical protein